MSVVMNSAPSFLKLLGCTALLCALCAAGPFAGAVFAQTGRVEGGEHSSSRENLQRIYPADASVVEWLRTLLAEQGLAPLFASGPYSGAELQQSFRLVERGLLSPQGRRLYDRVEAALMPNPRLEQRLDDGSPGVAFRAGLELNLEAYLQSNSGETDWLYGYERRRPLLSVPLELWVLESAYATMDFTLQKNYPSFDNYMTRELWVEAIDGGAETPKAPSTPNPDPRSNFPSEFDVIDPQFPFRSFVALGGRHWGAQFGRDVISWGPGRSGTLVVSDHADYHEALRFTTFFDRFKYSYFWANTADLSGRDLDPDQNEANGDPARRQRNYIGHRIEFRPLERLNIAVNEVYLIAKESMELRYLHPVMVFHNHFIHHSDSAIIAGLELDLALAPGRRLYAEYAFNSLMLDTLHGDSVEDDPNAWGALLGFESRSPRREGYMLLNLEAVYTNPWLYTHEQSYTSLTHSRRLQTEHIGDRSVTVEKPLGYWAGPDFVGGFVTVGYERPAEFAALARASLQGTGERDLYIDTFEDPYEPGDGSGRSPTGSYPQWRSALELEGSVYPGAVWDTPSLRPFGGTLELGSHLAGVWTWNRRRPAEDQKQRELEFDLQWAAWLSLRW